jgi:peptidylprolyl isomerase
MLKIINFIFIGLITLSFASDRTKVLMETSQGEITLELYNEIAPLAVENFTTHIKNGYYDGLSFHRIVKDFMVQGGDPKGDGTGGESIWGKPFKDELKSGVGFNRPGLLAMANSGPRTNGSQFFITTGKANWLSGNHTIFGEVINGADTMIKLNEVDMVINEKGESTETPLDRQVIMRMTILKDVK